jgi:RimJ/RimL family protein N-acetyltransferase
MTIREASLSDIKTLADFQLKLALESEGITLNKNVVIDGLTALINDRAKGVYYLALDEETPIGCHLITYEWSDWRNGMVWWLQSVYVAESYRNKKVFNAMFSNIQRMITADPTILGLRLYVDKTNAIAQKVYSRLGMNGDHYTVFELMK